MKLLWAHGKYWLVGDQVRIFPVSIYCGLWNYDGQCANATQRTSEHFQYTFNKVWLFFSFFFCKRSACGNKDLKAAYKLRYAETQPVAEENEC